MTAVWRELAGCTGIDTEVFYAADALSRALAKAACQACPVRVECLRAALANHEEYGVWGGTTPNARFSLGMPHRPRPQDWAQTLRDHGTLPGYRRHLAVPELPCLRCREANAKHQEAHRAKAVI